MVETGGLENRFTRKGNGGSNPSPSAIVLRVGEHSMDGRPRQREAVYSENAGAMDLVGDLECSLLVRDKPCSVDIYAIKRRCRKTRSDAPTLSSPTHSSLRFV